jgi:hypothetical protein
MLLRGQQAQALPVVLLALRGGTVAATRLLETLSHPQSASQAALAPAVSHVSGQQDNAQKSSNDKADSGNVLGVLTSLLLQQQQRPQSLPQQQAAAKEHPCNASAAMQWPAAASQVIPNPSCQPDLSAASSGQVRMESQLVFDSCWRRFREKRGMVSLLVGLYVLAVDRHNRIASQVNGLSCA